MPRILGTNPSVALKKECKSKGVRITHKKGGKIYYRTAHDLNKSLRNGNDIIDRYLTELDQNLELAINFYLLKKGVRPSFLLEFTDFSDKLAKRGVDFAKKEFPTFYQAYESTQVQKRYLISNPSYISKSLFNKAKQDDVSLGKVLGFLCPGGLYNKQSLIRYEATYKGKTFNVTSEFCDRVLTDAELSKIRRKWKSADRDNLKFHVQMIVLSVMDDDQLLDLLKRDNVNEIYNHRQAIDEKLETLDDNNFIKESLKESNFSVFKKWWLKFHDVVKCLVIINLSDPCEPAYPVTNIVAEEIYENHLTILENLMDVFIK